MCRTERETKNRKKPEHIRSENKRKINNYALPWKSLLPPSLTGITAIILTKIIVVLFLFFFSIHLQTTRYQIQHGCNSSRCQRCTKAECVPGCNINIFPPYEPPGAHLVGTQRSPPQPCPDKRDLCLLTTPLSQGNNTTGFKFFNSFTLFKKKRNAYKYISFCK